MQQLLELIYQTFKLLLHPYGIWKRWIFMLFYQYFIPSGLENSNLK
jgi:hypothetical protein